MSYAQVDGLDLWYDERGSGDPLVLLHGGVGASEMFGPILDRLAAGRRVITVDLPGTGTPPTLAARCGTRRWRTRSPG